MNRAYASLQLAELSSAIKNVIADIDAGHYDDDGDLSYEVALGHLMDHLSLAWHYSRMTDDEVERVSQEQFENLTTAIPKFQYNLRLVELHEKVV